MEEGEVKFEKFQIRRIRRRGGENDDSEDIENKMGKSPIIYKDKAENVIVKVMNCPVGGVHMADIMKIYLFLLFLPKFTSRTAPTMCRIV